MLSIAVIGFCVHRISDYAELSTIENWILLAVGVAGILAARSRLRYATSSALLIGLWLFGWGLWGLAIPNSWIGSAQPLENAIRLVSGLWGMYVSVHDVLAWRRHS